MAKKRAGKVPDTPCADCGKLLYTSPWVASSGPATVSAMPEGQPRPSQATTWTARRHSTVSLLFDPSSPRPVRRIATAQSSAATESNSGGPNAVSASSGKLAAIDNRTTLELHPPPPATSLIPWAACMECHGWFVARRGRRLCQKPKCVRLRYRESHMTLDARRRRLVREGERLTRAEIYERDGYRCGICGKRIKRSRVWPDPEAPSVDHIIPLSKGGPHTRANVQAAHLRGNWSKNAHGVGDQLRLIG